MEDSPLSIAANIAGLLTFAVAILASIYVRIASLRNGRLELEIIRESVEDNVQDLMRMSRENPSDLRKRYITEQGDEPDLRRLKNLSADLNATEIFIYMYCMYAKGVDETYQSVVSLQSVLASFHDTDSIDLTTARARSKISGTSMRGPSIETVLGLWSSLIPADQVFSKNLVDALQTILTVGSSPTLVRWYRVQEKVLENVRYRDTLRSRVLSLQVSMANSSATRGEEALQRIVAQQSEVKAKLEELTRLLTTASQAPARPASDDISGIPVETCTTVSPGQTEGIERHVDAEGSELETTDCFE